MEAALRGLYGYRAHLAGEGCGCECQGQHGMEPHCSGRPFSRRKDTVRALLEKGADVNAKKQV